MSKKLIASTAALGLAVGLSGCGDNSGSGDEGGVPITAYCATLEPDCESIFAAFTDETGIDVNFVRLSAGEIVARVMAERDNPQASLWFAGAADGFIEGAEDGLLEAYAADGIEDIDEAFQDPDNNWTPISTAPLGFALNEDFAEDEGISAPTEWEDLADPEFDGMLALADPSTSGTAYVFLSTLVQHLGEDEAFDLIGDIDNNVAQYTRSGSSPITMSGLGEIGLGVGYTQDLQAALAEGYPLEVTFPENTGYELNAAGLIADGPEDEKESSQQFLDWIITEDGQQAMADTHRIPLIDSVTDSNPQLPDDIEIDTIDYDPFWSGENRDRLLDRYQNEVQRGAEAE